MDISAYQHMNIRMSTRGKRPLRNLTPSDKVRAIQRIHNGETKASVSRDIGVPESTLRGWCKNEQKLRFMCRQLSGSDQLGSLPGLDASSLPEKRNRFESHIKTPQFPGSTGFEEFPFNRLPLSSLHYSTNGSNAILEKIAFNEIMKKHVLPPVEGGIQKKLNIPLPNTVPTAAIGTMPLGTDFAQLSIMQNLNLLSLLNPGLTGVGAPQNYNTGNGGESENGKEKVALAPLHITADDMIKDSPQCNSNGNSNNNSNNNNNNNKNNTNNINNGNSYNGSNNAISLSVKDWAKDPADNISVIDNVINGVASGGDGENSIHNNNKRNSNDTNNNRVNDKHLVQSNAAAENIEPLNFLSPLPLALLQIPNVANTTTTTAAETMDTENANAVLLEWYKVFNASLNFLALATAAAALQPANNSIQSLPSLPCGIVNSNDNHNAIVNGNQRKEEPDSTEENILYKELTKSAAQQQFETLAKNSGNVINSDTSNDSYLESEPEDLSVRSAATSKLSSPVNSCSQSPLPIKSSSSCSPHSLISDGEQ